MTRFAVDLRPRCRSCRKLLAEKVTRPWTIGCGRCKALNTDADQGPVRKVVLVDDRTGEVSDEPRPCSAVSPANDHG